MIFRLNERLIFPNPELAEEDGLLALGGDLLPERLMLAYQNGIFPWYSEPGPILWYSPHQRCVLYPNELKISKSMRRVLNANKFSVTVDAAFEKVIEACAYVPRKDQNGTWITADMQNAYIELYNLGYARSFEVWKNDELVGGIYGVIVGSVFCGESMFSKVSNASKFVLISVCRSGLYEMIDCQMHTSHLESMGARMINRKVYMKYLNSL